MQGAKSTPRLKLFSQNTELNLIVLKRLAGAFLIGFCQRISGSEDGKIFLFLGFSSVSLLPVDYHQPHFLYVTLFCQVL